METTDTTRATGKDRETRIKQLREEKALMEQARSVKLRDKLTQEEKVRRLNFEIIKSKTIKCELCSVDCELRDVLTAQEPDAFCLCPYSRANAVIEHTNRVRVFDELTLKAHLNEILEFYKTEFERNPDSKTAANVFFRLLEIKKHFFPALQKGVVLTGDLFDERLTKWRGKRVLDLSPSSENSKETKTDKPERSTN